jgi:hypothetical protein
LLLSKSRFRCRSAYSADEWWQLACMHPSLRGSKQRRCLLWGTRGCVDARPRAFSRIGIEDKCARQNLAIYDKATLRRRQRFRSRTLPRLQAPEHPPATPALACAWPVTVGLASGRDGGIHAWREGSPPWGKVRARRAPRGQAHKRQTAPRSLDLALVIGGDIF